ncbi:hypothetical protein [Tichowtungia aerotolerans]|uniref:Tetratricopeptide repeat protein n=1 Tax=Tichowtungia aerotolerans TaxID=2697043 RepID=A0A6P1M7I6_9BACT|nr:hypothetical protein [Tichowtungia aerotolerans]QHI69013.1 hypothetical protein GT409_05995 [Tichowtungia aerotolerans]
MLARGDFSAAQTQIENSRFTHYQSKDRALYHLDLGMLQHYLGDYKASNDSLEKAEQAMDAAFTKSVTRAAASMMLNDNVLEYAGEDYETVYVNVFKALNYLALNQFDPAFVEIRRMDEKLKVLESRYWKVAQEYEEAGALEEPFTVGKNRFRNSAMGRWLSLLIYRAEGRPDEAEIDLKKIAQARALAPEIYNFSGPDLSDALKVPSGGTVKVSLLGLIGQSPEKRADTLWIHTQQNQIFIAGSRERRYGGQSFGGANTLFWPGIEPGYTFKFQLPTLVKRGSHVGSIRVKIDGKQGPTLMPIESLENAAEATFEIRKPLTYLKTITRTVTKGIAAAQSQRAAEEQWGELYGLFTGLLAGAGVGVTEHADLRISRFFPARACVAETELTPGMHRIEFEYVSSGGMLLHSDVRTVNIDTSGLNLIESFYLN